MKILSADDSATIRRIIQGVIEVLGHKFISAENGKEVFDKLKENEVDLILLDWNMPEMDGYETLIKLKKNDKWKDIPVMMVTTESEKNNIAQAIAAGAVNYVTKPFSAEDLSSRIMECLGMGMDLEL